MPLCNYRNHNGLLSYLCGYMFKQGWEGWKEDAGMKKETESLTMVWRLPPDIPTRATADCVFTFIFCP